MSLEDRNPSVSHRWNIYSPFKEVNDICTRQGCLVANSRNGLWLTYTEKGLIRKSSLLRKLAGLEMGENLEAGGSRNHWRDLVAGG